MTSKQFKTWLAAALPGDLIGQLKLPCEWFGALVSPANFTRNPGSPVIGNYTRFHRPRFLVCFIRELRKQGFHPQYLHRLTKKHVQVVVDAWVRQGLAIRTIQTRLSAVRMLFFWFNRGAIMLPNCKLLPKHMLRVTTYATVDKSWVSHGLDVIEVAKRLKGRDLWIGLSLRLQRIFGLRVKESSLIQPHEADLGTGLYVGWGPKGGRKRLIPIETKEERDLLNELKAFVSPGQSLISAASFETWDQARDRYDYVIGRKLKITRKQAGVVSHGLRCEYLCWVYFQITGELPPVQGGGLVPYALDIRARKEVARRAGHNRYSASSAYLGRILSRPRVKKRQSMAHRISPMPGMAVGRTQHDAYSLPQA